MNKRAIIFVGIAAVVAVSAIVYATAKPKSASQPNISTASPSSSASKSPKAAAGAYIDYRSGIIEETPGTKILFFHAPWCPQCRKLEQSIKDGTIPDGVAIIKVDYDSNQALRKQYGVTIQTTLVRVSDDGALVKRYVAYDMPNLAAITNNLLD